MNKNSSSFLNFYLSCACQQTFVWVAFPMPRYDVDRGMGRGQNSNLESTSNVSPLVWKAPLSS